MEAPLNMVTTPQQIYDFLRSQLSPTSAPVDCYKASFISYLLGIAVFYETTSDDQRPSCTLAHVVATVLEANYAQVLTMLEGDTHAAIGVQSLLATFRRKGDDYVASIIAAGIMLVYSYEPDQAAREWVKAYWMSH